VFLALILWNCAACQAQQTAPPLPELTGYVVDKADILAPQDERSLSERLAALDDSTSIQFIVVTVDTLGSEPIDSLGLLLANAWSIGQRGLNNGLLLLLAPNDRKVHVNVGTGLEWQIPDSIAAGVIELMLSSFREGDYLSGLILGVDSLVALAGAVPWEVRYESLSGLIADGNDAVGEVAKLRGTYRGDLQSGGRLDTGAGTVRLLFPPYWAGINDPLVEGTEVTLFGRVVANEQPMLQVLGYE